MARGLFFLLVLLAIATALIMMGWNRRRPRPATRRSGLLAEIKAVASSVSNWPFIAGLVLYVFVFIAMWSLLS